MAERASLLALQLSCRGNAARERVLRDLVSFAEARGELQQLQALPTTPRGAPIDWLRLYEEVVARGGYDVVSRRKLWSEIAGKSCMGIDIMPFALARHYERCVYLSLYLSVRGAPVSTHTLAHTIESMADS